MTFSRALLASLATVTLTTPALAADPAGKPAPRACFRPDNVENFSAPDEKTVYLRVNRKEVYRLDLMGHCPDVDWAWEIALQNRGSSWICSPLDATVLVKTPIGPQRCAVEKMSKVSPEEVAALPKRSRP
jgi:hypothetical protein